MTGHDVVIVGAGLAGLACARALPSSLDVVVLEAGDAVGGRVRTDHVDGFTLDRGFQVLNCGYPELRRTVDLDALDLRSFDPAAGLLLAGQLVTLGNPLRRPSTVAGALRLPVGGLIGKAALAAYAVQCAALPVDRLRRRPDVSAERAWREAGIPPEVIDGVLRPFFSGVLLEREMATSRRFTDLMMRMFVRGVSTVPAAGMQALPTYLAHRLGGATLRLSTPVRQLCARSVETDEGRVTARAVVVATDAWSAAALLPASPAGPARGVTTVYHAAPEFPEASSMLLLDAGAGPVNNSIVISRAAPEYAPRGRALVATSLVHPPDRALSEDPDGPHVRAALAALHRTDTSAWEIVATYDLPHALPAMPAPHHLRRTVRLRGGADTTYVAGDHRDTSSIQGALVSGRRAAEAVTADLGAAGAAG